MAFINLKQEVKNYKGNKYTGSNGVVKKSKMEDKIQYPILT